MDFFEKYKTPIIAAVVGAAVAFVLSYLLQIPFWITGAIIAASASWLTQKATEQFDVQYARYQEKRKADKLKAEAAKADES